MNAAIKILTVLMMLQSPGVTAVKQYLEQQIARGSLKGAQTGVSVRTMDGSEVLNFQADTRLTPASNLKLITTGTALHAFGPDHRFRTELGYSGRIGPDGTLQGDLYILGGGDPTLGAKDSISFKADALFWKWKTLLTQAGIRRIDGRIVGDGQAWEGMLENDSWSYNDTGTYYGAGSDALCFYQNAVDLEVAPSAPDTPVKAVQSYPETPWMHFENASRTAAAGTGNSLYLYTTDLAPYAQLRGTYAQDRKPKTEHFANKYGALTCAYYFWRNLTATGWEVTGGYAFVDRQGGIVGPDFAPGEKAAANVEKIGGSDSPALARIARETNLRSDNFYAEALFRNMGEAATGMAVYDSCRVAVKDVLEDLGLDPEALRMEDGCGLSRMNLVSPAFLTDFLVRMGGSPAFPAFLGSLPHPGEGTLAPIRLQEGARIAVKSGSMTGVLCYSGYLLDGSGKPRLAVSLMVNGSLATQAELRGVLVRALTLLME